MTQKKQPAGLALRLIAADRLRKVLGGENFTPLTVNDLADGRDRALANRLVTTALRRHGHLDLIVHELLDRGMPGKSGRFEAVLRLSLAQLIYLPDLGAHSALFLAVEALKADTKTQHLTGLMNAVLRRAQANSARYWTLNETLLLPEDARTAWSNIYGFKAIDAFATALVDGAPLDLTLRDPADGTAELLAATPLLADSVRIFERDRPVDALPGYDTGAFWVQDIAAAIPARLLALPAGSRVLDLCAAPGGKTAQLVKAGHDVTALDNDPGRLERLATNLARLKMSATIVTADAASYTDPSGFDGVLLDAPCTATGTFRRHPETLWHRNAKALNDRVALQRRLLTQAATLVRPGGTLIYCVCSLETAEGEAQARWIGEALPGLVPHPIAPIEALPGAVGPEGWLRTHPGIDPAGVAGGMDGFFVARFTRRAR